MTPSRPKYWSGFTYTPDMRDGLHCTHCYFGTMSLVEKAKVIHELDRFFQFFGPIRMPTVTFSVKALFGPENNIPVLCASRIQDFKIVAPIRNMFFSMGLLSKTAHPFRPHVTTDLVYLSDPFSRYVFMRDGEILRSWNIYPKEVAYADL